MNDVMHDCMCWWPRGGPLHWDWRCLKCGGRIVGFFSRWRLRRQAAA